MIAAAIHEMRNVRMFVVPFRSVDRRIINLIWPRSGARRPLLGALRLLFPVDAVPVVLVGIGDRLLAFAPAVARRRAALRLCGPFARCARCLGGRLAFRRAVVACHRFSWSASVDRIENGLCAPSTLRGLAWGFTWRRRSWER